MDIRAKDSVILKIIVCIGHQCRRQSLKEEKVFPFDHKSRITSEQCLNAGVEAKTLGDSREDLFSHDLATLLFKLVKRLFLLIPHTCLK